MTSYQGLRTSPWPIIDMLSSTAEFSLPNYWLLILMGNVSHQRSADKFHSTRRQQHLINFFHFQNSCNSSNRNFLDAMHHSRFTAGTFHSEQYLRRRGSVHYKLVAWTFPNYLMAIQSRLAWNRHFQGLKWAVSSSCRTIKNFKH